MALFLVSLGLAQRADASRVYVSLHHPGVPRYLAPSTPFSLADELRLNLFTRTAVLRLFHVWPGLTIYSSTQLLLVLANSLVLSALAVALFLGRSSEHCSGLATMIAIVATGLASVVAGCGRLLFRWANFGDDQLLKGAYRKYKLARKLTRLHADEEQLRRAIERRAAQQVRPKLPGTAPGSLGTTLEPEPEAKGAPLRAPDRESPRRSSGRLSPRPSARSSARPWPARPSALSTAPLSALRASLGLRGFARLGGEGDGSGCGGRRASAAAAGRRAERPSEPLWQASHAASAADGAEYDDAFYADSLHVDKPHSDASYPDGVSPPVDGGGGMRAALHDVRADASGVRLGLRGSGTPPGGGRLSPRHSPSSARHSPISGRSSPPASPLQQPTQQPPRPSALPPSLDLFGMACRVPSPLSTSHSHTPPPSHGELPPLLHLDQAPASPRDLERDSARDSGRAELDAIWGGPVDTISGERLALPDMPTHGAGAGAFEAESDGEGDGDALPSLTGQQRFEAARRRVRGMSEFVEVSSAALETVTTSAAWREYQISPNRSPRCSPVLGPSVGSSLGLGSSGASLAPPPSPPASPPFCPEVVPDCSDSAVSGGLLGASAVVSGPSAFLLRRVGAAGKPERAGGRERRSERRGSGGGFIGSRLSQLTGQTRLKIGVGGGGSGGGGDGDGGGGDGGGGGGTDGAYGGGRVGAYDDGAGPAQHDSGRAGRQPSLGPVVSVPLSHVTTSFEDAYSLGVMLHAPEAGGGASKPHFVPALHIASAAPPPLGWAAPRMLLVQLERERLPPAAQDSASIVHLMRRDRPPPRWRPLGWPLGPRTALAWIANVSLLLAASFWLLYTFLSRVWLPRQLQASALDEADWDAAFARTYALACLQSFVVVDLIKVACLTNTGQGGPIERALSRRKSTRWLRKPLRRTYKIFDILG